MKLAWIAAALLAVPLMARTLMNKPSAVTPGKSGSDYWVYVGTAAYNDSPTNSLYFCRFNSSTGALDVVGVAVETVNPGFLAVNPTQQYLYAVNEIGEYQGQKNGAVSAFQIDSQSGKLTFLSQVPALGANPSFATVSKNGKFVLFASYYGGVVARPIRADGSLGDPTASLQVGVSADGPHQENSHPHAVILSPDNRFAIVPDLGLDRVLVFRFDEITGSLVPNDPPFWQSTEGSGPRHVAFGPNASFAYAINEMQSSLSILSFAVRTGAFQHIQTVSTLPANFKDANTGAEVKVGPSGAFVYASNRGHNSIAVFAIDKKQGTLTLVQDVLTEGKTPRNFAIDPSGNFLLVGNQDSNEIVEFRIDPRTGRLAPTGQKAQVPYPVCIVFVRRREM
ncbi:MAG: lactonase family protein [Candidatus Acidiferrales bacterium]